MGAPGGSSWDFEPRILGTTLPQGFTPAPRVYPLLGGNTLSRGCCWGKIHSPPIPWVGPPRCPPPKYSGTIRGSRRALLPMFSDFLGRLYYFHVAVRMTTCFFSRLCPPEELDNKRSSARRGEFDSSTPEAIGVLLGYIFLA